MPQNDKDVVSQYRLAVEAIEIPKNLQDDRCQLRLVVEIRYLKKNVTSYGSFVLPGTESSWNCKHGEPLRNETSDHVEVEMASVPDWDKTALFDASSINSVRISLYDTQGDGFWSKAESDLKSLATSFLGLVDSGGIKESVAEVLSDKMGSGSGNGKLLFRQDMTYSTGIMVFSGKGRRPQGSEYTVKINLQ